MSTWVTAGCKSSAHPTGSRAANLVVQADRGDLGRDARGPLCGLDSE